MKPRRADRYEGHKFTTPHNLHTPEPSKCIPCYVSTERDYVIAERILAGMFVIAVATIALMGWWMMGDDIKDLFNIIGE